MAEADPPVSNAHEIVYGTTLGYSDDGLSYTPLTGIKSIGEMPQPEAAKVEISRVDQATHYKQYAAGMSEPGTMSFVLGVNESTYATTLGLFRALKKWQVTFPSGAKLKFDGYIDKIGVAGGDGNAEHTVPVRIQVSGGHTWVAAA